MDELEKFKLAVSNSAEHMIITDADGRILYANEAAQKITGYSLEEMLGKTPRLWGGLMDRGYYDDLWRAIKTEKKGFTGEILNRRKNGQEYYSAVKNCSDCRRWSIGGVCRQ